MVPFLFPSSMDNSDLNLLERFIAKRELEREHKVVAPAERPPGSAARIAMSVAAMSMIISRISHFFGS